MLRKKKLSPRPTKPVDYPSGLLVETERATYYIKGTRRYRLFSRRVIDSWGLTPVRGSERSVGNLTLSKAPLGFRDGTLIHNIADGRLYLVSESKRRQIVSPDALERFGWSWDDAVMVSDDEANLHEKGAVIR